MFSISITGTEPAIFTNVSHNRWSVSTGTMSLSDSYLSPQLYDGLLLGFEGLHYGTYRSTPSVMWSFHDTWHIAPQLINSSYSAAILYASVDLGYGSYYQIYPLNGPLQIAVGGLLQLSGAIKYQGRNVNNISSADLEAQLCAAAHVRWRRQWNKFQLKLSYSVHTPIIGTFFAPEMGQSYYELYLNFWKNATDVIHFSSFHNRIGVRGLFSVDFTFRPMAFFIAFDHNYQWHNANHITCITNSLQGRLGVRLDIANLYNWR